MSEGMVSTVKVAGDRSGQEATALVGKATQDVTGSRKTRGVPCVYVGCSGWLGCRVGEGPASWCPHMPHCALHLGVHTLRGIIRGEAGRCNGVGSGVCPGTQCGEQAMVKEQREAAGVSGGGERSFQTRREECLMEAQGRVSPNPGSADHEAGTGRGSGRLAAGKGQGKKYPKGRRGGALGCGLRPAPPLPAEVLRGPLLEMTESPDCTVP